jgi:hypothetical protein
MTRRDNWSFVKDSRVIYTFFIILALNMGILWSAPSRFLFFGSGIATPINWKYHFRHSGKEEKGQMIAQKQINSYYYNRWYTPADSTEIDYRSELIEKRKRSSKISTRNWA